MTQLTHKIIPFLWTEQCQKAFEKLNNARCPHEKHCFGLSRPEHTIYLFMDASKYAWSAVLTQKHMPVTDGKTLKYQHPIIPR